MVLLKQAVMTETNKMSYHFFQERSVRTGALLLSYVGPKGEGWGKPPKPSLVVLSSG